MFQQPISSATVGKRSYSTRGYLRFIILHLLNGILTISIVTPPTFDVIITPLDSAIYVHLPNRDLPRHLEGVDFENFEIFGSSETLFVKIGGEPSDDSCNS